MIRMAGSLGRLRPHLKTHKIQELVQWQLKLGIHRFKAATLSESAMAAQAGAPDVLLAFPLTGPSVKSWSDLIRAFPSTRFSCLVDDWLQIQSLNSAAMASGSRWDVWLDLDVGQHRTGVLADRNAEELYAKLVGTPGLTVRGLHAYDGHISDTIPELRQIRCDEAYRDLNHLRDQLQAAGFAVPAVVLGGSPTFPIHARRHEPGIELSPGTTVLWDAGYSQKLPDLQFLPAAVLLSRVISKPIGGRLCLDLGHKAVASEMPQPRVQFLNLPNANIVMHSEEHLVVEVQESKRWQVGDVIYSIPWHICPTVALHDQVHVVSQGRAQGTWEVAARTRRLVFGRFETGTSDGKR